MPKEKFKKLAILYGKILLLVATNLLFLVAAIGLSSLIPTINPTTDQIIKISFELVFWLIFVFLVIPFLYRLPKKYDNYNEFTKGIHLSLPRPYSKIIVYTIGCYAIFLICQLVGSFIYGQYVFDISRILPPKSYWLININAGFFEEIMFRGIILALLLMHHSKKKSVIISSVIFGLVHFPNLINGASTQEVLFTLAQVAWAIGMGILWAILTIKTRSLLPSIFLHYLSNAFDSLWLFIPSSSFGIQLLYKVIFAKFIPILLSILFVLLASKLFVEEDKEEVSNLSFVPNK